MSEPTIRAVNSTELYTVSVRQLCEFAAKVGDLDLRFTPSPSAQEGIVGHNIVAARRTGHYESEVPVQGQYQTLIVRGRADGFDPSKPQVDEVKTHRGALNRMPANHRALHWAQVKVYGWLFCQQYGFESIKLALVYFEIGEQTETIIVEEHQAADLKLFFQVLCERFVGWGNLSRLHRQARDAALSQLKFPHTDFRLGQRQLAQAVYRAATAGRVLLAQAPTGIGKTIGTIFPLLKAIPDQRIDKIFFLTAKTSGRQLALDALQTLQAALPEHSLRAVELIARDKACEHPDKACHGESCPLAAGFYDRLAGARQAASLVRALDKQHLREVALAHQICPYYLGQEMVRWSDVVIGDYNYYFDTSAMLYAMTVLSQWRVGLLVDEAHNLLDRTRAMYSAELDFERFRQIRQVAPKSLKSAFDRVHRAWNALRKNQTKPYQAYDELPFAFSNELSILVTKLSQYLADFEVPGGALSTAQGPSLQALLFELTSFQKIAQLFDERFLFDQTIGQGYFSVLSIRNIVPAPCIKERFVSAQSVVLFSGTLNPLPVQQDLLGVPDTAQWIDVQSPFSAAQLSVNICKNISTRYQDRLASVNTIVDLIIEQYKTKPGNYLAFFSSYQYLTLVQQALIKKASDIPVWTQARSMDENAREQFLAQFKSDGQGVAFAVLGGAFAEGIDLPGSRLIGAFVATLGLPQVNEINEQIKDRIEKLLPRKGYDYTYLYPGLQKVVQAAGRVIRTTDDQGVLFLMDDRFAQGRIKALLPSWWAI